MAKLPVRKKPIKKKGIGMYSSFKICNDKLEKTESEKEREAYNKIKDKIKKKMKKTITNLPIKNKQNRLEDKINFLENISEEDYKKLVEGTPFDDEPKEVLISEVKLYDKELVEFMKGRNQLLKEFFIDESISSKEFDRRGWDLDAKLAEHNEIDDPFSELNVKLIVKKGKENEYEIKE